MDESRQEAVAEDADEATVEGGDEAAQGEPEASAGELEATEEAARGPFAGIEALEGRPELRRVAMGVFDYANFLLDDDENLTRLGNMSGAARELLQARTLELLSAGGGSVDDAALEEGLELEAVEAVPSEDYVAPEDVPAAGAEEA